jgi:multicomponent Na+:H+ antiporter subunit E
MSFAATVIGLAIVWAAVTGALTLPNIVLGAVVAAVSLMLLRDRFRSRGGVGRALRMLSLGLFFLREVLLSAISVAAWVVRPNAATAMSPRIIAFPLTVTRDVEITLLANLITLTPGTLSIDVSDDRRTLYVHALDCRDPASLKKQIADGFERKIIEAFR